MKLIIDYDDDVGIDLAIRLVRSMVANGRVSESRGNKQFCFVSIFSTDVGEIEVLARERKQPTSPDSFKVRKAR